jgi:hypothetical protein
MKLTLVARNSSICFECCFGKFLSMNVAQYDGRHNGLLVCFLNFDPLLREYRWVQGDKPWEPDILKTSTILVTWGHLYNFWVDLKHLYNFWVYLNKLSSRRAYTWWRDVSSTVVGTMRTFKKRRDHCYLRFHFMDCLRFYFFLYIDRATDGIFRLSVGLSPVDGPNGCFPCYGPPITPFFIWYMGRSFPSMFDTRVSRVLHGRDREYCSES